MSEQQGTTFIAIYHGATIATAKLISVTARPETVAEVARRMLEEYNPAPTDNVLSMLATGKRRALQQILENALGDI